MSGAWSWRSTCAIHWIRGRPGRDVVEFVLGASYYYLGQFDDAQPIL